MIIRLKSILQHFTTRRNPTMATQQDADLTICTLHLLSSSTTAAQLLDLLAAASQPKPLFLAKANNWIIQPEAEPPISPDLMANVPWSVVVIYTKPNGLPQDAQTQRAARWTLEFSLPTQMASGFVASGKQLRETPKTRSHEFDTSLAGGDKDLPSGSTSLSQALDITPALSRWFDDFSRTEDGTKAIVMLNLIAFVDDGSKYLQYRNAFAKSVGSRHGAAARLLGTAEVESASSQTNGSKNEKWWDRVALIHYPSILHFADMLAADDYQEASHKYRTGSLVDNPILCLTEVTVEE